MFGATFELADILEVELNTNLSLIMLDWCEHDLPASPSISRYLPILPEGLVRISPSFSAFLPLSLFSILSLHLPTLPDHT